MCSHLQKCTLEYILNNICVCDVLVQWVCMLEWAVLLYSASTHPPSIPHPAPKPLVSGWDNADTVACGWNTLLQNPVTTVIKSLRSCTRGALSHKALVISKSYGQIFSRTGENGRTVVLESVWWLQGWGSKWQSSITMTARGRSAQCWILTCPRVCRCVCDNVCEMQASFCHCKNGAISLRPPQAEVCMELCHARITLLHTAHIMRKHIVHSSSSSLTVSR